MRRFMLGLVGLVALTVAACGGPSTYTLTGTVTLDGNPLPEGYIAFVPLEASGAGGGATIKDGHFEVRAPKGKNRVEITASKKVPLPEGQLGMYGEKEEERQYLPERYNFKSELEADVTSSTPLKFELNSK